MTWLLEWMAESLLREFDHDCNSEPTCLISGAVWFLSWLFSYYSFMIYLWFFFRNFIMIFHLSFLKIFFSSWIRSWLSFRTCLLDFWCCLKRWSKMAPYSSWILCKLHMIMIIMIMIMLKMKMTVYLHLVDVLGHLLHPDQGLNQVLMLVGVHVCQVLQHHRHLRSQFEGFPISDELLWLKYPTCQKS